MKLPSTPATRTPSSGVIIELLFLCATALTGSISALAIERARRPATPTRSTEPRPQREGEVP